MRVFERSSKTRIVICFAHNIATLSSLSWLDIILMCWIVNQFYHVYRFDYLSCPFTLMLKDQKIKA